MTESEGVVLLPGRLCGGAAPVGVPEPAGFEAAQGADSLRPVRLPAGAVGGLHAPQVELQLAVHDRELARHVFGGARQDRGARSDVDELDLESSQLGLHKAAGQSSAWMDGRLDIRLTPDIKSLSDPWLIFKIPLGIINTVTKPLFERLYTIHIGGTIQSPKVSHAILGNLFIPGARDRARPVPPLRMEELRSHSDSFVVQNGIDPAYRDYAAVLINSEMWREQLAAVPYERRLLLLPKCLRVEDRCPAPFDEFGLLCKQCGLCSIQDLQEEAERLGYAVLVAEGSAIVMALIQTGKIDAIVGVSCLSVLERAFPYMEAAAIPGIAIPLLQDDCKDTTVDLDWVWDVIHLTSEDRTRRLDLDALRREVQSWFEPPALDEVFGGKAGGPTEEIARLIDTTEHDVTTRLASRVPRVYLDGS